MRKEIFSCDVCKKEKEPYKSNVFGGAKREDKVFLDSKIQIIFTTEQTEGRSCKPYLSIENLDICDECLDKAAEGNSIFAHGAQGHNTYYFNKKENEG